MCVPALPAGTSSVPHEADNPQEGRAPRPCPGHVHTHGQDLREEKDDRQIRNQIQVN